jgi:hypothetical protein
VKTMNVAAMKKAMRMRPARLQIAGWRELAVFWVIGIAAWLLVAGAALRAERTLGSPAMITGYALFVLMIALWLFNLRKRVLVLPLGTVRQWMIAHGVLGTIALPLYWQHTGSLWPTGFYEQALALCFYVTMVSGIVGWIFERLLPRRLSDLGAEVIYERIPTELHQVRLRAEALVVEGVAKTGSSTLGRYYSESLHWYFRRPRFLLSHIVGAGRGARWIGGHIGALRRYLNESERAVLDQIEVLALRKNQLDAHYALQSLLKLWLFVHVPGAVLLIALACWHLLVVNVYAL